jgi:hypothetical protein
MLYIIKSWRTQIGGLSIYWIMYSHPTDGCNIYKGQEGNQECPVCLGISGNDLSTFVNNNTRRAGRRPARYTTVVYSE